MGLERREVVDEVGRWVWLSERLTSTALRFGYLSAFLSLFSSVPLEPALVLAGALFLGPFTSGLGDDGLGAMVGSAETVVERLVSRA